MSDPGSLLQVRSKIWLEIGGEPVFGQGRDQLLRSIRGTGSINAAAKEMGIPTARRGAILTQWRSGWDTPW
ncbi:MAG: hypothetical protein A2075_12955 [Geobacteraceae bacterium GWC2_58_44]|nr:MAG: hypothetical protein A2075_12955 [Geobacteraceae bacterium GWC2_58_44]